MYRKLVIVDLEATCWEGEEQPQPDPPEGCIYTGEIIEIGSVSLDLSNFSVIHEVGEFVRPRNHPVLSEFCKELTTIRQGDVDKSKHFIDVIPKFVEKHDLMNEDVLWSSWGKYDQKQLADDYRKWGFDVPSWVERHVNLKEVAREAMDLSKKRRISLRKVLNNLGLDHVGTQHRGIDDARTYANVIRKLVEVKSMGVVLEKLERLAPEHNQIQAPSL